jgi:hypothetical protein
MSNIGKKTKWETRYEDQDEIIIWKYDLDKAPNGPYSVEIRYKKPPVITKVKRTKVKI